MSDVTATCGCGRKMSPVGTAQRGTFRCGCGVQVLITVEDRATCFGMAENGERCRLMPVREAVPKYGVSLCGDHLEGYESVLKAIRDGEAASKAILTAIEIESNEGRMVFRENPEADADLARRYAAQSVVYYIRLGDRVKIGTTVNMAARMSSLVPDEILATEPGDRQLEKMRHKQFAAQRIRGERFRLDDELAAHIAMIREHFGPPVKTGYLAVDKSLCSDVPADAAVSA